MSELTIYRKRLIPPETVCLKDDTILTLNDTIIVTSWKAIREREDLSRGFSCYYLKEDIKLSRMIKSDGSFHWYFDIADYAFDDAHTTLTMTDLLADVAVMPDGQIRVLDLDELADAHDQGLIDDALLKKSLRTLDRLLTNLYRNGVDAYAAPINKICDCR